MAASVGAAPGLEELAQAFDYAAVEELDPSMVNGYQLYYEREVPFELRSALGADSPNELGALEAIRVKILNNGDGAGLEAVRVELSSESNLFFVYAMDVAAADFKALQDSQRLMVEFGDFPNMLVRMLNAAIREPHATLAVFIMQPTGEARLDFIQNMEYKFVELLSLRFMAVPEEAVRAHVSYRYNVMKARLNLAMTRLADINAMVKVKNPSLLLQLQRTPPKAPSQHYPYAMASPQQAPVGMAGTIPGPGMSPPGAAGMRPAFR